MSPKRLELTGERFGRLVVVGVSHKDKAGHTHWIVECDCGTKKIVCGGHLQSGGTQSCGCLQKEARKTAARTHGMARTATYKNWQNMRQRCLNPNHKYYKHYGGRGITVCKRWLRFENFLTDMGEMPKGLSIERRNNNDGYSKENCYWATNKQQQNNTRTNVLIKYDGRTQTLTEWSEELGIHRGTLRSRLRRGWPVERILNV